MKEATDDDVSTSTTNPVAPESRVFAIWLMAPMASAAQCLLTERRPRSRKTSPPIYGTPDLTMLSSTMQGPGVTRLLTCHGDAVLLLR